MIKRQAFLSRCSCLWRVCSKTKRQVAAVLRRRWQNRPTCFTSSLSRRGDQCGLVYLAFTPYVKKLKWLHCEDTWTGVWNFCNGSFVDHEVRVAKCDVTKFMIPGFVGASRPLFVWFEEDLKTFFNFYWWCEKISWHKQEMQCRFRFNIIIILYSFPNLV